MLSAGEQGYGLHYGRWDDEDHLDLVGFESMFDAWAFLFAHISEDVSANQYERRWTCRPAEVKVKQLRMEL